MKKYLQLAMSFCCLSSFPLSLFAQMTYTSCNVTQVTGTVPRNTANNPIQRMEVVTSGSGSPLTLNGFTFNTNGTTDVTDITSAKLWRTTVPTFQNAVQLGSAIANPNGTFSIVGFSHTLAVGSNYFWLTYDLPYCAKNGNVIDAEVTALFINNSAASPAPTPSAPTGSRTIGQGDVVIWSEDFTATGTCNGILGQIQTGWSFSHSGGSNRWITNNVYSCCSQTVPAQPNSIPNANGSYMHIYNHNSWVFNGCNQAAYNNTSTSTARAVSPVISTSGYDSVRLSFWYLCNGEAGYDMGNVEFSYDGTTWNPLLGFVNVSGVNTWTQFTSAYLTSLSNRATLYFRFVWQNDNSLGSQFPFSVDAIRLTGRPLIPITNAVTWNGSINTDWANANNWTPSQRPNRCIDISIPSTLNQPVIGTTTAAECRNLSTSIGSSLTLNMNTTGAFRVYGNVNVNGTITDNASIVTSLAGNNHSFQVGASGNTSSWAISTLANSRYTMNSSAVIWGLIVSANSRFNINNNTLVTGGIWQRDTLQITTGELYIYGQNAAYFSGQAQNPQFDQPTRFSAGTGTVRYAAGLYDINHNQLVPSNINYHNLYVYARNGNTHTLGTGTDTVRVNNFFVLWNSTATAGGNITFNRPVRVGTAAFVGHNGSSNFGQGFTINANANILRGAGTTSFIMGTQSAFVINNNYANATLPFGLGFNSPIFYGTFNVNGISLQRLAANSSYANLNINNASNVSLLNNITVGTLFLTNGKLITTTTDTVRLLGSVSFDLAAGNSYVQGNLRRTISGAGTYNFPVGSSAYLQNAQIIVNSTSGGLSTLTATYLTDNPSNNTYNGGAGTSTVSAFTEWNSEFSTLRPNGYWRITPNTGSANYDMTLYPRPVGGGGSDFIRAPDANNAFTIVRRTSAAPSQWLQAGTIANPDVNNPNNGVWSDNSIRRTGLIGFSNFAVASGNNPLDITPLPISLLSFTARRLDSEKVMLSWTTASEKNNKGFEIEMSSNGKDFQKIDFVKGLGNSNSIQNYEFRIMNAQSAYYRLKQIDFDGQVTYSEVRFVSGNSEKDVIAIYPNPFKDKIYLQINELEKPLQYRIVDATGKVIQLMNSNNAVQAENSMNETFSQLPAGAYFLHIRHESTQQQFKLIKLK